MIHLFVINPVSFSGDRALRDIMTEIESCFTGEEADDFFFHVSRYPRDATVIIRKYLMTIPETETVRVYAVGGDGILFDCLNGIVGMPNAELASVPYGNSNDVVRMFGENRMKLFRDIKAQIAAETVPIDIIHCGNNYALNFCAVGLEADTVLHVIKMYGKIRKWVKQHEKLNSLLYKIIYLLAGAKAIFSNRSFNQRYAITIDGEDWSGEYRSINISNGPCYGGDKNAVITAVPNDGILDSIFFRPTGRLKTVGLMILYIKGEFRRFPKAFVWKRLRKIEVRSDDPLLIQLDGEAFFDASITVEIIPAGIKFAAPGGVGFYNRMGAEAGNG